MGLAGVRVVLASLRSRQRCHCSHNVVGQCMRVLLHVSFGPAAKPCALLVMPTYAHLYLAVQLWDPHFMLFLLLSCSQAFLLNFCIFR